MFSTKIHGCFLFLPACFLCNLHLTAFQSGPLSDRKPGQTIDLPLKRFNCPLNLDDFCIFPFDDLALIFQDCSSGFVDTGLPPTHINVPPSQAMQFSLVNPPASGFRDFAIVSEAVANGNPADVCLGGSGVFVGPLPIDVNTNPFPTIFTIPSAVINQMIAQVAQDGFVVMLAMNCSQLGAQLFSGLDFTRNAPLSSTDLTLNLGNKPTDLFRGEPFSLDFTLANNGDEPATDPVLSFELPVGLSLDSASIDGQDCVVNGNQVSCTTDTLLPAQTVGGTFTATPLITGKMPIEMVADFVGCEANNSDNIAFFNPLALPDVDDNIAFGLGSDGGGFQTEIWVANPFGDPAAVTLWTTDPNCVPSAFPLGGNGMVEMTIPAGAGRTVSSMGTQPLNTLYLWWLRADTDDLIINIRHIDTGQTVPIFLGSTQAAIPKQDVGAFDEDYPIPFFDIVTGQNQVVSLTNLSDQEQTTTSRLRNALDGTVTTQFDTTLQPFQIQQFPLDQLGLPGTDPHAFWKAGGQKVVAKIQIRNQQTLADLFPGVSPDPLLGEPAQPFFRPDPLDAEYDPSELEMYVVKQDGSAITGGRLDIDFDTQNCEPQTPAVASEVFLNAGPFTPIFLPIPIDDQVGGFGTNLPEDALGVLRWAEGESSLWFRSQPPISQGLVQIPKDGPAGNVQSNPANTRLMIRSEADMKLPITAFDKDGNLINFTFLEVPMGSNLYCLDDITLSDELDFLEFQVPPGQPGDVWFNAIADEPDLEYKDHLPTGRTTGNTRTGAFTKVLEAWEGNGSSCIGDNPDILDIVDFMENGLKCP